MQTAREFIAQTIRARRARLGIEALDEAQQVSTLTEDEALELATAEVHTARRERR